MWTRLNMLVKNGQDLAKDQLKGKKAFITR